ncbi:MAG: sulfite exporter TauE/SafE family protein [Rickettsia endosymbiont of Ixodes persulcatus]|nr:sulfite exporter TauE/SafE family protein [Rickettsia endosymbiont of Ixodes persulcatus]
MIPEILDGALLYLMLGVVAGILAGLFGIGGGIVVVPALLFIFHHHPFLPQALLMRFAVGTSLAIMLFTTQAAVYSHLKLGGVLWSVYQRLWLGLGVGVLVGSLAANFIPTNWLTTAFGIFLLFVSWKMFAGMGTQGPQRFPSVWLTAVVTVTTGFLVGLLGIGGGTLIIPYLTYCGVRPQQIIPVTALCSLTLALIGTLVFMGMGYENYHLPLTIGYIYWPAVIWVAMSSILFTPIGAKLTYLLPVKQLRFAFVILLLVTSASLLL